MANALFAAFGGSNAGFTAMLNQSVNAAQNAGKRIVPALTPAAQSMVNWRMFSRELLVIFREIGRGNWARIPGSFTILVQSLGGLQLILNPLVLTIAAVAASVLAVGHAFKRLANIQHEENQVIGVFHNGLRRSSEALEECAIRAEKYSDWLKHLADDHKAVSESVEETLTHMREQFELTKGISKEEQARREKGVVAEGLTKANENLKSALEDSYAKEQAANQKPEIERINNLKDQQADALELVKQREKKVEEEDTWYGRLGGEALSSEKYLAEHRRDQARADYAGITENLSIREKAQRMREREAEWAKEKLEDAEQDVKTLEKIQSRVAGQSTLETPGKTQRELIRGSLNERQRVGLAYVSPASVAVIDVNKQILNEVKAIHRTVKGAPHGGKGVSTHGNY